MALPSITVVCMPLDDRWTCQVTVAEGSSSTEHRVIVHRADLDRLAPGSPEPEPLIRASFEFLLERESKESILRSFELTEITGYFPEFERAVQQLLPSVGEEPR